MLKVLVLGCNSFIGKHLVAALEKRDDIRLSVFARNVSFEFNQKTRAVSGNFEDAAALRNAIEGQNVVYHLISQTIPSTTWNSPFLEIEKNLVPTLKFIELAAESGVKKICFASSGGTVYGLQQNLLTETSPTKPFSPHGIIKRTIESFLEYARLKYQVSYDIYRISNVYGEGQNIDKGLGFINTALENIINRRSVTIYGDGENVRDYIYVRDVVKLLLLSVSKSLDDSDTYNVSSGDSISLNNLTALIRGVTRMDFEVKYVPNRLSDNSRVFLDNSKIMQFFSETRLTSLQEGIRNTYFYLKERSASVGKETVRAPGKASAE